ncbi:MAG TPA: NAD(P)/FAD-dependent oxidoreductase [Gammaproteobacteria bacterium]|nr:NAD(P)/FAD-dependent oxidoreductase [Gammaproteobacteria bacterium]
MQAELRRPTSGADVHIAILGAGFSGLGMGIRLLQSGIRDFTLFERAREVGGTWRDNSYPGAACDVSSHLYSFSFEQWPEWSRAYAEQPEIERYIRHCTDKHGLRPYIRFNTEIERAEFDDTRGLWTIRDRQGRRWTADIVVNACGGLSDPAYPDIPGLGTFRGRMFHTARWDHDFELAGKRVALIGSGASAIQAGPAISRRVARLSVFQRTPSWILPKPDRPITEREKRRFRRFPFLLRLRRWRIFWLGELVAPMLILDTPVLKRLLAALARKHVRDSLPDREMRRKVTPDYHIGCKRVLISNDWYPMLRRANVELVTEGIESITPVGIRTRDGREREFDAIVMATGFKVPAASAPFDIRGRGGVELNRVWRRGAEAYKGVTVSGFPNLFLLMGPNTGPGHTSVLIYTEKQMDYVIKAIRYMDRRGLKWLDVRKPVQEQFNRMLQRRMKHTVWTSGCSSWYLSPDGRNTTLYPGFSWEYRLRMLRFRPSDYEKAPAGRPGSRPVPTPAPQAGQAIEGTRETA